MSATKKYLTNNQCATAADKLAAELIQKKGGRACGPLRLYGIPRGGISASYLLLLALQIELRKLGSISPTLVTVVDDPALANIFVDDLVDSGATMVRYLKDRPDCMGAVLFLKDERNFEGAISLVLTEYRLAYGIMCAPNEWLVFPWEVAESGNDTSAQDTVIRMMQAIGEDVTRQGLQETPKRVVKAWEEWFKGYHMKAEDLMKTFKDGAEKVDEMVLLTEIPVFSHCEHHITPFIGVAHVAYIPNGKIVGLSKIVKVVEMFSRRLQVQERLTNQIADCIVEHLDPLGVAVVIKAKHFCMATRGVKSPNVDTTTSAVRGVFKDKPEVRAEFFSLLRG